MTDDVASTEEPGADGMPDERPSSRARTTGLDPSDLSIAFTPKQIIGGFALLAALVMLLRRRNPDRRRD
jgi:MYXO-CTERM domain-containing protein